MAKTEDDNEEWEEATLLEIKQHIKDFSLKKLNILVNVLINSLCDLTKRDKFLNKKLYDCENEKIALDVQISELEEKVGIVPLKIIDLKEKVRRFSKFGSKGKSDVTSLKL